MQYEAESIGFYLSAHPLDNYASSMKRLGVQNYAEISKNVKSGDHLQANLAGCLQSFQRKISKSGKPFAFVKMSDTSGEFEGLLFSEGIKKYADVLESGAPLYAQVIIDKQSDDAPPRMMFNVIKTLDDAIAENSKGLIICVSDVSAVRPIREALRHENFGTHKVYIKPEIDNWDVRIELKDGYALADGKIITAIRGIPGVTMVEEI